MRNTYYGMPITSYDTVERLQQLNASQNKPYVGWSGSKSNLPPSYGTGQVGPSWISRSPSGRSGWGDEQICQICDKPIKDIMNLCGYYDEETNEYIIVCKDCLEEKHGGYTSKW